MSGQVPNQNGNPLPPPQMQNLAAASTGGGGPPLNQYSADPELLRVRTCMREKIISMLMQKSVQPVNEAQRQKVKELTIRLEEGLFRAAQTKDDYMNLNTLESRLSNLIRRPTVNSHNQRHVELVNSSPPIGNMIPTPGMPHNANSNMMVSSVDTMMVTSSGCDRLQAHMSGQVPNQNGNPLPPPQMQNLAAASTGGGGPPLNQYSADPELLRVRTCMREKIISMLMQKSVQPVNEAQRQKVKELTIRLEEGLFRAAQTKDDYMNLNTLESRLSNLIRRPTVNSHNQRHVELVNSSPPIGNMIPTPGMPHNANSNMMVSSVDTMMVTSSGCDNIAPISINSGNLLSTGGMRGGSFSRADGTLSNGYQQSPASFSISSGGNMPSMGVHRMPSQMIPTPGFNSSNNNNNNNNQSYMNMESSNNSGGYSSVESTMVSQPQQQKQYVVGQNSRIRTSNEPIIVEENINDLDKLDSDLAKLVFEPTISEM